MIYFLLQTRTRDYKKLDLPNKKASELKTEPGSLGQMKGPTTKLGTRVTISNPCCSPNSRTAFSASVLETAYDQAKGFKVLRLFTSLQ